MSKGGSEEAASVMRMSHQMLTVSPRMSCNCTTATLLNPKYSNQKAVHTSIIVVHHLPPLFHLPLVLAWQVNSGHPDSTERKKTSLNTEKNPDFALENMSKSCWQQSHFHMAVFPPKAARLWRMVTHAWAVIISHAGVSSGFLVLPCCFVLPQLGADLQWCWRSKWSRISTAVSSTSAERTGIRREHTACHAAAQLGFALYSA